MTYSTILKKLSLLLCFISLPSLAADNFYNRPHTVNDAKQFKQQCDAKQVTACAHLAYLYEKGEGGLDKDLATALQLYQTSCDQNDAAGCAGLGNLYHQGEVIKQDYKQAVSLSESACKNNDLRACFNLGFSLELGYGIAKNMSRALDLYQQTCEQGYAKGCINLAVAYDEGKGVGKDTERVLKWYKRGCDELNNPLSCVGYVATQTELASDLDKTQFNNTHAKQILLQACQAGEMKSCTGLYAIYSAKPIPRPSEADKQVYSKIVADLATPRCKQGDEDACQTVTYFCEASMAQDTACVEAGQYFGKKCQQGDETACTRMRMTIWFLLQD
jgi:hypothetical protein